MIKIGSHVSMSGKDMLYGSVKEALSYNANAMMIYTGAPQNTRRKDISELKIEEANQLLKEYNINKEDIIVHAPYIINLGNSIKEDTFELAVSFLKEEIKRTEAIGSKYIVLHPGAHVGAGEEIGIQQIIKGLNEVIDPNQNVIICLETMAGKGSEIGKTFEELNQIISGVKYNDKLGICLDTCHIHDAGYSLDNIDKLLEEFDTVIGLDRLKVIHVNDSKNEKGARKDRHENLGYGYIGFDKLNDLIYHDKTKNIVKILETPYIDNKTKAPYKEEITMIRNKQFTDWIQDRG